MENKESQFDLNKLIGLNFEDFKKSIMEGLIKQQKYIDNMKRITENAKSYDELLPAFTEHKNMVGADDEKKNGDNNGQNSEGN